jgi:CheY-like chemotaxis protein
VTTREAQILIVDDSPGDVRLIEEAFHDGDINNNLHIVKDGQQALNFIHQRGDYEDAPQPDIVLLDLKLPRVDGEDVLHEIKHHPELGDVPVIILTGLDEDLIESRDLDDDADKDGVLKKPIDPDEFVELICGFENFRLSVVYTDDD